MVAIFSFLLIIIFAFIGLDVTLYRRQARNIKESQQLTYLPFRWSYILLPLVFLAISIVTVALYYGKLPTFNVPYHFATSGVPDTWAISPLPVLAVAIGVQVILVLFSLFIVLGVRRMGILSAKGEMGIKPKTIIAVMGNMPTVLQFISFFYTLDIFNYAAFQKHLLPMWLLLVIMLVLITAAFIVFSIFIALRTMRQPKS